MTKDNKSVKKGTLPIIEAKTSSQKLQSESGSAASVRLLTKIEIKDTNVSHNLLVPAPVSSSVQ